MTEESEDAKAKPPLTPKRRRFRWWWWILGVLLLLAVFHQPLLRAIIKNVVISLAKSAHLDASFHLKGSVWTNLEITNLKIRPAGDTPVERLDAGRIYLSYDLAALRRPHLTGLVDRLEIQDMTVDVDQTKLPPLPEDQPIRFPFILPRTVIVDRLDVNFILANKSVIAFDDFNIRLSPGEDGYIAFKKLSIPGLAPIENYDAPLSFENREIVLKDLVDTSIGQLDEFSFDGSESELANFSVHLAGALLGGDLRLDAKVTDFNRGNLFWLRLSGYNLTLEQLRRAFPAFEPLSGSVKTIHLTFDGPLEYPRQWTMRLDLEGNDLRWADLPQINAGMVVTADKGALTIQTGRVATREERMNISGTIQLPENIKDYETITGELDWDGSIDGLERFTGGQVRGNTDTTGKLVFGNSELITQWTFTGEELKTAEFSIATVAIKGAADVPLDEVDNPELWKQIDASVTAELRELNGASFSIDAIAAKGRMSKGTIDIEQAQANIDGNFLKLQLTAKPADLSLIGNPDLWSGTIEIAAPNLAQAAATYVPSPLGGSLSASGVIKKQGADYRGTILLDGSALSFDNLYVQTLKGRVIAQGQEFAIAGLDLYLQDESILSGFGRISINPPFAWNGGLSVVAENAGVLNPWLLAMLNRPINASGRVLGAFAASGDTSGAQPHWNGAAYATEIRFGDAEAFSLALPLFGAQDNAIRLPNISVQFPGGGELRGSALISNEGNRPFETNLSLNLPRLEALEPVLRELGFPMELAGSGTASVNAKGTLADHTYEGTFRAGIEQGRVGELTNLNLQIEGVAVPGTISVPTFGITSNQLDVRAGISARDGALFLNDLRIGQAGTNFITGEARMPLRLARSGEMFPLDEPVAVKLKAANVEIPRLLRSVMPEGGVRGRVNLDVEVSGPLGNPTGTATLAATGLQSQQVAGFAPANIDLQLNLRDKRLELAGNITQSQLKEIKIAGNLPLDMERILNKAAIDMATPVSLDISMDPMSLSFLRQIVPGIRILDGTFDLDVNLRGTVGQPQLSGSGLFAIETLRMENEAIPPIYAGRAQLEFRGQQLTISGFQVEVAGGPLAIGGRINFPTLTTPNLDLWIKGSEVLLVRNDAMIVRSNLDLVITGPLQKADVRGAVGLTKSRFFRDIEIVPLNIPGRPAPPLPGGPPEISVPIPPFKDWNFDATITTVDPFNVRGNLANGEILVNLALKGTGLEPKLIGNIRAENLLASLPFSRLTVDHGYLYFSEDRNPADPVLDLRGSSTVRDTRVEVYVYGTAQSPSVLFTSQPPMSQEEIITLLATGVTQEEIAAGGASIVASRTAWLYLQRIYRRVFGHSAVEDQSDDFINRIDFDIGGIDPETGQQSFQGRFRITDQFQLIGDISLGANVRLLLRYLIRFR